MRSKSSVSTHDSGNKSSVNKSNNLVRDLAWLINSHTGHLKYMASYSRIVIEYE